MNLRHLGVGVTLLLMHAAAAHAEGLTEYKGTIKGALAGRIEIYQADNTLEVAFGENRTDGSALLTRGKSVWKLTGKWSACQHADSASYCQLAGSSAVYRFASSMTKEDRAQTTYVLAATNSGYAARVTTSTGDLVVHHPNGGVDKTLWAGKVTEAWSSGGDVNFMINSATLREVSLTTFEARDRKVNGPVVRNIEQSNTTSSPTGGLRCISGDTYCEEYFGVSCTTHEQQCTCEDPSMGCAGCSHGCTIKSTHCPDPRKDEPECGDPGCGPAAMSFGNDVLTGLDMCAGSVLYGYECDLTNPGPNCSTLPPITLTTTAPADVQVTTKTLSFGAVSLPAGTPVSVQRQSNGDIYLEAPQ
jgi:hypothetical protein